MIFNILSIDKPCLLFILASTSQAKTLIDLQYTKISQFLTHFDCLLQLDRSNEFISVQHVNTFERFIGNFMFTNK